MRRYFIILLFVLNPLVYGQDSPTAAMGVEAGFSKISHNKKSATGPSWVYHFEAQLDQLLSFFGEAGQTTTSTSGLRTQNIFSGGIGLDLFPLLELRLGAGITGNRSDEEFGPLAGCNFRMQLGAFLTGPSVTYIQTKNYENASLRWMLLLEL